jgi:hypothetical protein
MLRENTGRHALDSGDFYGRNWERNAGLTLRDFRARPEAQVRAYCETATGDPALDAELAKRGVIELRVDAFHWLRRHVRYDAKMNSAFHRWARDREGPWIALMCEWAEDVRGGAGLYGEGQPWSYNSYESEPRVLSQVIQFVLWEENGAREDAYVLLQIHGGCDVRGGYTAPKAFRTTEDIFNLPGSLVTVTPPRHGWAYDSDGSLAPIWLDFEPDLPLEEYGVLHSDSPLDGIVRVDSDGTLYSPVNGEPLVPGL